MKENVIKLSILLFVLILIIISSFINTNTNSNCLNYDKELIEGCNETNYKEFNNTLYGNNGENVRWGINWVLH